MGHGPKTSCIPFPHYSTAMPRSGHPCCQLSSCSPEGLRASCGEREAQIGASAHACPLRRRKGRLPWRSRRRREERSSAGKLGRRNRPPERPGSRRKRKKRSSTGKLGRSKEPPKRPRSPKPESSGRQTAMSGVRRKVAASLWSCSASGFWCLGFFGVMRKLEWVGGENPDLV